MLVIRLARTGRAKYPTYRIVAAESARAATGKHIAVLGHYNPHTKELVMKTDDIKGYMANGAQPSNTVVKLLTREKVELPAWVKLKTKVVKKSAEAEATPVAEVSEATEAPAEEVRVAEVNEDAATAAETSASDIDTTETAANQQ